VKCDETKPACLRCEKTGRKCDGYVPKNTWKLSIASDEAQPVPLVTAHSIMPFFGNSKELRAFSFFRERTGPNISKFSEPSFWNITITQAAWSHPAVKHSLIAVASLHESLKESLGLPVDLESFSVQQYNQAIRYLTQGTATTEVVLLSCLLFIAFEVCLASPINVV
jgi:hypothetical protein